MKIESPAFSNHGEIPTKYTCEGDDVSPALLFGGIPAGTRSLALVVDDPDAPDPAAPKLTWVHWVLYDIPPSAGGVPEAAGPGVLGARDGLNSWMRTGYGGPCPPVGRHRYFHKVHALDVLLGDLHQPDHAALERAMAGHVLASAQLVGTYRKTKR